MSGMLVPVGVGIAGALFILGALYSIKVMNRRRRNGFKRHKRKVGNQQQQKLISFRTVLAFLICLIKHAGLNDAGMVLTCPVVRISCCSCFLGCVVFFSPTCPSAFLCGRRSLTLFYFLFPAERIQQHARSSNALSRQL